MNYFTILTEYFNIVFPQEDYNSNQLTVNMSSTPFEYPETLDYPKTEEERFRFFNVCGGYLPETDKSTKEDKKEKIDGKSEEKQDMNIDFINISQMLSYYKTIIKND